MSRRRPAGRAWRRTVGLLLAGTTVFALGLVAGSEHWLSRARRLADVSAPTTSAAPDLLQLAFTEPLAPGPQLLPAVHSLEQLQRANEAMLLPVDAFFDAYRQLAITGAETLVPGPDAAPVLRVDYRLADRAYSAYAYAVPGTPADARGAALFIPGSGQNQSSAIALRDRSNYHFGVLEALGEDTDRYVLVKPNEDLLAIHDGRHKLGQEFYLNWLINQGGSYTARYIADALALTRYLQDRYDGVVVAGLSQGGFAALLVALQAHPDGAVVASGYSVRSDQVSWAGHDQILIPSLRRRLPHEVVRSSIRESATQYLFTYGRAERATYGMEARTRRTCTYFASLPNVSCGIHDGGHAIPVPIVAAFVRSLQKR